MAKTQNPKTPEPKPEPKVRKKRTAKPLIVLEGEPLKKAGEIEEMCVKLLEVVGGASSVPVPNLLHMRRQFSKEFMAVVRSRRGNVLERKRDRLERAILKAQGQLEALMG